MWVKYNFEHCDTKIEKSNSACGSICNMNRYVSNLESASLMTTCMSLELENVIFLQRRCSHKYLSDLIDYRVTGIITIAYNRVVIQDSVQVEVPAAVRNIALALTCPWHVNKSWWQRNYNHDNVVMFYARQASSRGFPDSLVRKCRCQTLLLWRKITTNMQISFLLISSIFDCIWYTMITNFIPDSYVCIQWHVLGYFQKCQIEMLVTFLAMFGVGRMMATFLIVFL